MEDNELTEYLNNEVKQDIGFDLEGNPKEVSKDHLFMLKQKYGLMAPVLTEQETNWLKKIESRKRRVRRARS